MSLWDLYQHRQIRNIARNQALADQQARMREQRHERTTEDLEERLEELGTIVEALWALCRDRFGMTDDDLKAGIQRVLDERQAAAAAGPVRCTGCGAAIGIELDRCQFCGLASPRPGSPFSGV